MTQDHVYVLAGGEWVRAEVLTHDEHTITIILGVAGTPHRFVVQKSKVRYDDPSESVEIEDYEREAHRFFCIAKRWGAHVSMEAHYSGAHYSHDFVYIEVGDGFCCCFEKDGSITSHPWDYNDFDYALQDAKTSAEQWLAKREKSEEE